MTSDRIEALTPADVSVVLALVDDAYDCDGVPPLSDQALLNLRRCGRAVTHAVSRAADGSVAGYVQFAAEADETVGELVVAPGARRRGIGTGLAQWALENSSTGRPVRAWAHGNLPPAGALAAKLGLRRERVLFRMGRSASVPLPVVALPAGVRIRTFRPGLDDEAWVAVNARAFAHHPEQGRLGVSDLRDRMSESWFDPAGFFLAERDDKDGLAGFHWTKVHTRPVPAGEVYVIGVDPSEQGTGLGLALTVTGLDHLVSLGLPQLMLYADESNAGAVRMYEQLDFAVTATDVMYGR